MDTLQFLRVILPETDCWYFLAVPAASGKGFGHTPVNSIEELAAKIKYTDENSHHDIYFACSGYREEYVDNPDRKNPGKLRRQHRTHENVNLVKAYWLDLDVGPTEPGKPPKYATQGDALKGLNEFLIATEMPKPMIVNSGYGIHAYWPLNAAVLPGQWNVTAALFKQLTNELGLLADNSRTSDSASILRPIGTHNRKVKDGVAGSVPVTLLYPFEHQPVELVTNQDFHKAVESALRKHGIEPKKDKSESLRVNPDDMVVPVGGYGKVIAIKVAERCNQIKIFRDTGGISEPHWYRSLQVVRLADDGEHMAHEWSAKYEGYTETETASKLAQLKDMGPTLCATFQQDNPDGCKNCPFAGKITTPLQLGAVVESAPPPQIVQLIDGEEKITDLPQVPYPFKRGNADNPGLFIDIGDGAPIKFYPYDLFPFEVVSDQGNGDGRLGIRHHLPREGWREFAVRLELIVSPREFLGQMHKNFVHAENGKYMVAYMEAYLKELQAKQKIKVLHNHFGWVDGEGFVLGNKLYARDGTHHAGLSSLVSNVLTDSYKTVGDHDKWQEVIRKFDRDKLEAHLFTILCGFAAPLVKFTGHGGMVAHMDGYSNAGKTLAARAMASIYGNFAPFKAGQRDTFNARIERMGMLANLPAYLDELTNVPPKDVSELIYMASQGTGKTRLRSDSSTREAAVWNTIVVTSANGSLAGKVQEIKLAPEAELVRLFEYPVVKHAWFEKEMPGLYDTIDENYGTAGPKYIKYLVSLDQNGIKAGVKQMIGLFQDAVGFEGKERFWIALIGCVMYSLWLADASGAVKFDNIQATYQRLWSWCMTQVLRQRGAVHDTQVGAVESLAMFLNANQANRLVVVNSSQLQGEVAVVKQPAQHGELVIEYNQTTQVMSIDQAIIRNFLSKHQMNALEVRRQLIERGIMLDPGSTDKRITMGRGTIYKNAGQTRVWQIDMTKAEQLATILAKDPEVPV